MKRIVIIGPESTGKTTLTKGLAAHFQVPWVKEYAREYLQNLDRTYREEDLLIIAKKQLEREVDSPRDRWLLCDTDLRVIKIWSLIKYGRVDPWIVKSIAQQTCDLYLLCDIDLPWRPDPQREHPQQLDMLFSWYIKELKREQQPFELISGSGPDRLKLAIDVLESLPEQN